MSYDSERAKFGRERIEVIEIDSEKCALTYGTSPCTATTTGGSPTGSEKCKNSFATCQDLANYDGTATLTTRYCTARSPHPIGIDAIPSLRSVSVTPTKIDLKGGLGERAHMTVEFDDHPSADRDIDPYVTERTYDPLDRGSYWTKFRAIFPNYQFRAVRHLVGYLVDDTYDAANFQTRHYIADKLDVGNGRATLIAKDPLSKAMSKKALMPAPNSGTLSTSINATDTSATLSPSGVGNDEYAASGYLTIDKEVMSFTRSGDTLTLTRGQYNTTAVAHDSGATIQEAYQKNDQVHEIVQDALALANIDSSFIPASQWQSEVDTYLTGLIDGIIVKPTDVKKILVELAEAMPHYLWWDEREQLIQLTALKAPPTSANVLNVDDNLIENSTVIKDVPDQRVSTVFVSYGQIDPTQKLDEPNNYEQTYARIDSDSITKYDSSQVKVINSRWLTSANGAAARQLAALIGRRFSDVPRSISFALDAKDSDVWAGQTKAINHRDIIDPTSSLPVDTVFQIMSVRETEKYFEYTGLEFTYGDSLPEDEGGGDPDVDLVLITVDDQDVNLRTVYDGLFPTPDATTQAKFVIESGVKVGSTSTSTAGLDTGSWPTGATVTLQINSGGYSVGRGGDASSSTGSAGGAGGTAIILNHDLELINNGVIGGGGGGGGAGSSIGGGGTGTAGGGGGAGYTVGAGGIVTLTGDTPDSQSNPSAGSTSTGGSGGSVTWGPPGEPSIYFALGGNGGNLGQAGSSGSGDSSSAGGAAGAAIDKNGYTLTQTVAGTIHGSILT